MDNLITGVKTFPWYVRWLLVGGLMIAAYKLAEMIFGTFFAWLGALGMVLVPLVAALAALNIFKGGSAESRKEEAVSSWTNLMSSLGSELLASLKESAAKIAKEVLEQKPETKSA